MKHYIKAKYNPNGEPYVSTGIMPWILYRPAHVTRMIDGAKYFAEKNVDAEIRMFPDGHVMTIWGRDHRGQPWAEVSDSFYKGTPRNSPSRLVVDLFRAWQKRRNPLGSEHTTQTPNQHL